MSALSTIEPMSLIRAALFDYGLVLSGPPDPAAWLRMQSLLKADDPAFHDAYWRHRYTYDLGLLDGLRYWQTIGHDIHRDPSADDVAALIEADVELWTQPNQPMIDWAASLQREDILTGILSNMPDAMEVGIMARLPWMSSFPRRIFSHRLGIAKPDEQIYRYAMSALAVQPNEILFIDDRLENVAAARSVHMQAIQYVSQEDFLTAFEAAGFNGLPQPRASSTSR